MLDQYEQGEAALTRVAERSTQDVESRADPFVPEAVQLLDTIPGVGETVAQIMVAESGVDLNRFPTAPPGQWGRDVSGEHRECG